jgi:phosphoglycerate kinase
VGTSLLEEDQIEAVKGYLDQAAERGVEIVLPTDIVAAESFSADAAHDVVAVDAIPADRMGLDIGPDSAELFAARIADARTIVWNGPPGVFEFDAFADGTRAVAQAIIDATATGAFSVVGGGDSAAAVRKLGFDEAGFGHISTGGGASLELLEGKSLPGIAVLED